MGREAKVLWEKNSSMTDGQTNVFSGLTENYMRVRCDSYDDLTGLITPVLINRYDENSNTLLVDLS